MRILGNYLLRSRIHAIVTLSVLTAVSVFTGPLAYFISGVPLCMVALRKGVVTGLQVALGSLLLLMLIAMVFNVSLAIPLAFAICIWLPLIVCAGTLRTSELQAVGVLTAGMLTSLYSGYVYIMLEDIQAWWEAWFNGWKEQLPSDFDAQQLDYVYQLITPLISTFLIAGFIISLITALLVARWWQSALFNPGGFRSEFHSLKLPRAILVMTGLFLALMLITSNTGLVVFRDMLVLFLSMYLYQGLSAIHGFIHNKGLSKIWLIFMYASFFLLPHAAMLLVSCAGIANACMDIRWQGKNS